MGIVLVGELCDCLLCRGSVLVYLQISTCTCTYHVSGKYGSTSYIGMTRKKKAANRKCIGLTTLIQTSKYKHFANILIGYRDDW